MCQEEQDKLIVDNIPLIYKVIKDMNLYWNTEDEFQEYYDFGLEGLINGAKAYDPTKYKPSTFLYVCIKNMIIRCIQLSEMQCRKVHKTNMLSLDTFLNEDSETTFLEKIEDENINIEEEVEQKIQIETIIKAIDMLENKKDALAIKMYFEIDGYTGGSYEKVGQQMNVSREMIRSRINRAIPKIQEKVKYIERYGLMIENKKNTQIINAKNDVLNNNLNNNLNFIGNTLIEQLNKVKNLDLNNEYQSKMEIARSNSISSISKTFLQTVGVQLLIEKERNTYTTLDGSKLKIK